MSHRVVVLALIFIAGIGASFVLAGAGLQPLALALLATIAVVLVATRKSWLALGFYAAIFITEEFLPLALLTPNLNPRDIILQGGRVAFTNPRVTYLYSQSVGIRGLYAVEVLLLGLLAVFLLGALWRRQKLPFPKDVVFMPMVLTLLSIGVSAVLSMFIFPDTTPKEAYHFDEVDIGLTADVAVLVPYFQMKIWLYVYLSYALTRLVLVNQEMVRRFLITAVASTVPILAIGGWRVYQMKRGVYTHGAVYYDDATLFVLILVVCFIALGWSRRLFSTAALWWHLPIVAGCLLVLAVSPRRATWFGAAVCLLLVLAMIPARQRLRIAMVGAMGGLAMLLVSLAVGWRLGSVNFESVGRDASAVYRYALFYNLLGFERFTLFGYGMTPLWNVPLKMGAFQFNFESVHSLYYWFILRMGLAGLAALLFLCYRALRSCWQLRQTARAPWLATVGETMFIGIALYMFLGLFHPVYAMARFALLLGMLLGTAMACVAINDERRGQAPAPQSQL